MKRTHTKTVAHHSMVCSLRYLYSSALSLTLLGALTLVPLAPVFANESIDADTAPAPSENETTQIDDVVHEPSVVEKGTDDSIQNEAAAKSIDEPESPSTDDALVARSVLVQEESAEETSLDTAQESSGVVVEDAATTIPDEDTATDVPDTGALFSDEALDADALVDGDGAVLESGDDTGLENIPEVDSPLDNPIQTPIDLTAASDFVDIDATTTETITEVATVTNDATRFTFSKDECTVIGDGSFYCGAVKDADSITNTDRIFAAPDAGGDKEIFVERDGAIEQFTFNDVDDDAPHYDPVSESLVWHRLIDGRYQIVSFFFEEGEEHMLTSGAANSMEPSRYNDVTVWQAWVGDNWEIMVFVDGEITQLTDNSTADIAPSINTEYIVWQSQSDSGWYAQVYDRTSETIVIIENAEGLSIENARFVLVYDTKHENGDIEMRGYDLKNKRSIPLAVAPGSVPTELPSPDQTGEDRALVQLVTQIKPKMGEDDAIPSGDPEGPDIPQPVDIHTGSSTDLVVSEVIEAGSVAVPTEVNSATSVEHIADLVIAPPTEAEIDIARAHIEDLLVQPYTPEPDSQEVVASGQ